MTFVQLTLAPTQAETTSKTLHYEDELKITWAESLTQISESRYRKPSANDYGIYTPDIDHGLFCRCCTPINSVYVKRSYQKKKTTNGEEGRY